jgi:predicted nucleotidyltransferase
MINASERELDIIINILKKYVYDGEVRAFGSRHKQTAKNYSDLDVAIVKYDGMPLPVMELASIKEAFEESELPYRVDILDYWRISGGFRNIIDKSCEIIYSHKI